MVSASFTSRRRLCYFWESYFNWHYYMLICPFRINLCCDDPREPGSSQKYKIKYWRPQKLVCALLTIHYIIDTKHMFQNMLPAKSNDPSKFLIMGHFAVIIAYKFLTIKLYWFNPEKLLLIFNFVMDSANQIPLPKPTHFFMTSLGKFCFAFLRFLFYSCMLGQLVFGKGISTYPSQALHSPWCFHWLWTTISIYKGWLVEDSVGNGTLPSYPFTLADTLRGVLSTLGCYTRVIADTSIEVLLLISAGTLWASAKTFGMEIEEMMSYEDDNARYALTVSTKKDLSTNGNIGYHGDGSSWIQIQQRFEAMKVLAALMNDLLAWGMSLFVLETILYYAVSFDDIFVQQNFPDLKEVVPVLVFCANSWLTLLFAID